MDRQEGLNLPSNIRQALGKPQADNDAIRRKLLNKYLYRVASTCIKMRETTITSSECLHSG